MILRNAVTLILLATLPSCVVRGDDAPRARPNVLFLISDDLNCDLGSYGHPLVQSPSIDQLAQRGVQFERAYCQYPLCGPSRASFMTGLYPDQTLVRRNSIYIREGVPNVQTVSQMFAARGTSPRVSARSITTTYRDISARADTTIRTRGTTRSIPEVATRMTNT